VGEGTESNLYRPAALPSHLGLPFCRFSTVSILRAGERQVTRPDSQHTFRLRPLTLRAIAAPNHSLFGAGRAKFVSILGLQLEEKRTSSLLEPFNAGSHGPASRARNLPPCPVADNALYGVLLFC